GQRVSDFMRFNKDMIRIENGKQYLEFRQVKTSKLMTVALHPKVIEILDKRSGEFPRAISDQKYNEYIKEVCRLAEIDEMVKGKKNVNVSKDDKVKKFRSVLGTYPKHELVSSHIGRRSFSSNFYGT